MTLSEMSDEELIAEYKRLELIEGEKSNFEQAIKVLLNGGYGAVSNIYFLYFQIENAEAITLTGQAVNQFINTRLEKFFQKLTGTQDRFWIMADTDSGYFELDKIVKMLCKDETDRNIIADKLDEFCKKIVQPQIDKLTEEFADYLNSYQNRMVYEREAISRKAILCAKKKYVMEVIDNEGTRFAEPDLKVTGMEAKKSSTPAWAREYLKECYSLGIAGDERVLQERVEAIRKEFYKLPVSTIAIPSGITSIKEHIDPATGRATKGTPKHVKAAINHNRLVAEKKLDVDMLLAGNKLKYVELKMPNPIGEEVIAFESYFPKEFGLNDYIDRDKIFEKSFLKPLEIFLAPLRWNYEETVTLEDFFS